MAVKQDFAKQLESQIAVWQAQIKEHQDEMAQAGAPPPPRPRPLTRSRWPPCRPRPSRPPSSWPRPAPPAKPPGTTSRPPPPRPSNNSSKAGPTRSSVSADIDQPRARGQDPRPGARLSEQAVDLQDLAGIVLGDGLRAENDLLLDRLPGQQLEPLPQAFRPWRGVEEGRRQLAVIDPGARLPPAARPRRGTGCPCSRPASTAAR